MRSRNNDRNVIEYAVVLIYLNWKAHQSVAFTFDLVAVNTSIHHSDIYTGSPIADSKLLNQNRVSVARVTPFHFRQQRTADIDVTHMRILYRVASDDLWRTTQTTTKLRLPDPPSPSLGE